MSQSFNQDFSRLISSATSNEKGLKKRATRPAALEVDRMVFNPQPGWEDDIGRIK
jgi:hypothetical protein